jgi:hypothetical protein
MKLGGWSLAGTGRDMKAVGSSTGRRSWAGLRSKEVARSAADWRSAAGGRSVANWRPAPDCRSVLGWRSAGWRSVPDWRSADWRSAGCPGGVGRNTKLVAASCRDGGAAGRWM